MLLYGFIYNNKYNNSPGKKSNMNNKRICNEKEAAAAAGIMKDHLKIICKKLTVLRECH